MASNMAKTIIFFVLVVFITSTLSNASRSRTYEEDTPTMPSYKYDHPVHEYKNDHPVHEYKPNSRRPDHSYQGGPYYTQPYYTPYNYYYQPSPSPTYQYNPPPVVYTPTPPSPTYQYNPPPVVYTQPPPSPTYQYNPPPVVYTQPPPSPTTSSGGSDKEAFLQVHNVARASLGLPPFVWDDTVAAFAQSWANQRINDCRLVHSDTNYGENIFWGSGGYSAAFAVQSWVNERKYYDYYSNSCMGGMDCGHYTQIIWKKSTRLGCARVRCNDGGVYVTCNYDPPGNYIGVRPY